MPANTHAADINEIYFGYFLNGKKWFDSAAKQQIAEKKKLVSAAEVEDQIARAEKMADEFISWAKSNGYATPIKNVWWTARPNSLQQAVTSVGINKEVDSRKNPTDILVQFSRGPNKGLLGASAKSTKTSGDIGFKNPGMGTVEASLSINLRSILNESVDSIITKFKLPENSKQRKEIIRSKPNIQAKTTELGSVVLCKIRDAMFKKLKTMNAEALKDYILSNWIDADEGLFPPYVKVTGMGGASKGINAKVENPLNNEKISALMKYPVSLEKVGNESIGVSAGSKKILKMRAKFESEKLASNVKFSGDPW